MSDYVNYVFYIEPYKARKEDDEYIVLFNNNDSYYVVNQTGILILDYIRNNSGTTIHSILKYLELEYSKLSTYENGLVKEFIDKMIKLDIIKINHISEVLL